MTAELCGEVKGASWAGYSLKLPCTGRAGAPLWTRRIPAVKPGFPRAIPVCLIEMLCTRDRDRPRDQCPPCGGAARAQPAGRESSAGRTPGRARPSRRKRRLPGSGGARQGPRLWRAGPARPGLERFSAASLGESSRGTRTDPCPARGRPPGLGNGAGRGRRGAGPGQGPAGGGRLRAAGTSGLGCWQCLSGEGSQEGSAGVSGPPAVPAVARRGAGSLHVSQAGLVLISRASPAEELGAATHAPASAQGSSLHPRGIPRVEMEPPCRRPSLPSRERTGLQLCDSHISLCPPSSAERGPRSAPAPAAAGNGSDSLGRLSRLPLFLDLYS